MESNHKSNTSITKIKFIVQILLLLLLFIYLHTTNTNTNSSSNTNTNTIVIYIVYTSAAIGLTSAGDDPCRLLILCEIACLCTM
jgi:heme/copper-type cytochrome/quinol oxidase subunit 4